MQIPPSPQLAHIVRHFLVLESERTEVRHQRLFSDGHTGMVFHYGAPLVQADKSIHPGSFLYGQITAYKDFFSNGRIGMLIVVFQPYGMQLLSGLPAYELTDKMADLRSLIGNVAHTLEEQVITATDTRERIRVIEAFLISRLNPVQKIPVAARAAVDTVRSCQGLITVAQLCAGVQTGERKLERLFRQEIGISPQQFINIIKLQHSLKMLQQSAPGTPLTGLAYDAGYYDQAHFIRTFRRNAGITPGQYVAGTHQLAVNFIQFT